MSVLRQRLSWWWNQSGLVAAASAGKSELDKRDMNALIFDSPGYGVTVAIARGERAEQLREAWATVFSAESSDGTHAAQAAPDSALSGLPDANTVPSTFYEPSGMSTSANPVQCRACSGRGIVLA